MSGSNDALSGPVRRYGSDADTAILAQFSAHLSAGGIAAIPTETVYGLAADSAQASAVAAIYRAKGRPDFNPLIVHVPDLAAAHTLAEFSPLAEHLASAFWPGPLTLVLPRKADAPVDQAVTAGLPSIALRCPAHPAMQALLRASGLFLAAPSANRSGHISPTTAEHVVASLGDKVPLVLDAGPCSAGVESTIVAVRGDKEHESKGYQILRPGPVTAEMLAELAGPPLAGDLAGIEAPGQLASHYAPAKPVRLNAQARLPGDWLIGFGAVAGDDNLSETGDLAEAASRLFAALHRADASDAATIAVAPIPMAGMGAAINDRLGRAAADRS